MSTHVYFGNLSVEAFEKRTGVEFSNEDKEWFNKHRQDSANKIKANEFHIFDKPFTIHCGYEIFDEMLKILYKYDFSHSESFTVNQLENKL